MKINHLPLEFLFRDGLSAFCSCMLSLIWYPRTPGFRFDLIATPFHTPMIKDNIPKLPTNPRINIFRLYILVNRIFKGVLRCYPTTVLFIQTPFLVFGVRVLLKLTYSIVRLVVGKHLVL